MRSDFRLIRLLVTFATQPLTKRIRAFATSMLFEKTDRPDCIDTLHWRPHKTVNEIDVVDHQIQHDADIQATWLVTSDSIRFDELWLRYLICECGDYGVESLEVSDLKHEIFGARKIDELAGLFHRCGERLFQKHVDAALQKRAGNIKVRRCGCGNYDRRDLTVQFTIVLRGVHSQPGSYRMRALSVDVDDGNQLRFRQRGKLFGVALTLNTDSYNGCLDRPQLTADNHSKVGARGCRNSVNRRARGVSGDVIWTSETK